MFSRTYLIRSCLSWSSSLINVKQMDEHLEKTLFSSWCWHVPLTPSVVLVSSLVGIDSFKGSKCMFETVFDLSAGGIIMQKTLLRLS